MARSISHPGKTYYPQWHDPFFEQPLCPDGYWKEMIGGAYDEGYVKRVYYGGEWAYECYIKTNTGTYAGASPLQGLMNGGSPRGCKYPNDFYGKSYDGNIINGEAVVYYIDIGPLYLNLDIMIGIYNSWFGVSWECPNAFGGVPRNIVGLVLMGWLCKCFNDYEGDPNAPDVFVTIEPQFFSKDVHNSTVFSESLLCSSYGDASYHRIVPCPPKSDWQSGERLKFSINLAYLIKNDIFLYDWRNAKNMCPYYSKPTPSCLTNDQTPRIIDLVDHIHIYAVYPYVEACCGETQAYFFEVSITEFPKYQVVYP